MHIRTLAVVALAALGLLAPPAWAAAEGGDAGGGLLSPDFATILTGIGVFLLLLFVLTKLAWKPILTGLQQREEAIRKAVDDAAQASEEARALVAEYQAKLDTAKEEAQAIADEARKNAEDVRRRIEEDARQQAEDTLARSVREIRQAKDTAFDELLTEVTAIAAEAASRIVRKEISPEANAALVDEVIEDFAKSRQGEEA